VLKTGGKEEGGKVKKAIACAKDIGKRLCILSYRASGLVVNISITIIKTGFLRFPLLENAKISH